MQNITVTNITPAELSELITGIIRSEIQSFPPGSNQSFTKLVTPSFAKFFSNHTVISVEVNRVISHSN